MESGVSVNSKTYQANVAVLEDHAETADCIRNELRRDGKVVSIAKTLDEFEVLIKGESKFDVCSIDWKIGDRYVGNSALSLIKTYEKEAGKVVYSVYVNQGQITSKGLSGKADFVLKKIGENYDEYRKEVEKAAKLGISRHISRRLSELGTPLSISLTPSTEEEFALCKQARQLAYKKARAGEDDELIDLLKRRGWWAFFDITSYSNLPIEEKLTLLFGYVDAQAEDLAQIFQCSLTDAQKILNDKKVSNKLEKRADEMLSILAYVLRLSKYEPALMSHYWTVPNLFAGSLSSPPWDASGLYEYLKSSGITGIEEALYWIRSH